MIPGRHLILQIIDGTVRHGYAVAMGRRKGAWYMAAPLLWGGVVALVVWALDWEDPFGRGLMAGCLMLALLVSEEIRARSRRRRDERPDTR
ncbi:hypothetical protein GCM10010145_47680 [Streptomyces ruber]|uniref:Uncharacterized protein n=2 Tax=Streptomyces TaxID=1883 RepID=A0A918EU08_9ACTN|nr:hypothetical protein [Streptomyces ruber]GGQ72499.1 hypothetical protein GCM10010145_47680 [Streptomyces ruber]